MSDQLASDEDIDSVILALESGTHGQLARLDALIGRFPDDPRLHFLKGSALADDARPVEAHQSLVRAVEIAPSFAIARYQLGFFELTSGEPERARVTWEPLLKDPDESYLRVFVEGMLYLVGDEFDRCLAKFRHGISLNKENEALNRDIRLLISEVEKLSARHTSCSGDGGDELSATSLMLDQFGGRGNRTIN